MAASVFEKPFCDHNSLCPIPTTFERSQKGYLKTKAATVIYVSYIKSICQPWYQGGGTSSGIVTTRICIIYKTKTLSLWKGYDAEYMLIHQYTL